MMKYYLYRVDSGCLTTIMRITLYAISLQSGQTYSCLLVLYCVFKLSPFSQSNHKLPYMDIQYYVYDNVGII